MNSRTLHIAVFSLVATLMVPVDANARGRGGRSSSSKSSSSKTTGGTVHVKGYYREDGRYVQPYTRSAPGSKSYIPDFSDWSFGSGSSKSPSSPTASSAPSHLTGSTTSTPSSTPLPVASGRGSVSDSYPKSPPSLESMQGRLPDYYHRTQPRTTARTQPRTLAAHDDQAAAGEGASSEPDQRDRRIAELEAEVKAERQKEADRIAAEKAAQLEKDEKRAQAHLRRRLGIAIE